MSFQFSQSKPLRCTDGAEVKLHSISASDLDSGAWSKSRPGRFTAQSRKPGSNLSRNWLGPRAELDVFGDEKTSEKAFYAGQLQVLSFSRLGLFAVSYSLYRQAVLCPAAPPFHKHFIRWPQDA